MCPNIICYQCQGGGGPVNGLKLIIGLLGALFFFGGGGTGDFCQSSLASVTKKVISLSHIIIISTKPIFFSTEILQRKGLDLD